MPDVPELDLGKDRSKENAELPPDVFEGLTHRQQKFVQAMASGKKKKQAAIEAGYKEKSASPAARRLMKDKAVLASIEKFKKYVGEKTGWDAERFIYVLEQQIEIAVKRGQMNAVPPMMKQLMAITGVYDENEVRINGKLIGRGNFQLVLGGGIKMPDYYLKDEGIERDVTPQLESNNNEK